VDCLLARSSCGAGRVGPQARGCGQSARARAASETPGSELGVRSACEALEPYSRSPRTMTGLGATAGSTCASRASGGHGGPPCRAGVPHAHCVEDARERARRLERIDYVLADLWIDWWCALAVERLV
jgi:hypothetical protein